MPSNLNWFTDLVPVTYSPSPKHPFNTTAEDLLAILGEKDRVYIFYVDS